MLQLIREALRDPRDGLEMRLLFANQTPADILCRAEIDGLAGEHPDRLKVWYTVDRPEEGGCIVNANSLHAITLKMETQSLYAITGTLNWHTSTRPQHSNAHLALVDQTLAPLHCATAV